MSPSIFFNNFFFFLYLFKLININFSKEKKNQLKIIFITLLKKKNLI
jgi:hypothetical protein